MAPILPIRTRDELLTYLRSEIASLNTDISFADHSVAYDISLYPASVMGERLYLLADFVERTRTLAGLSSVIDDEAYKERVRVVLGYQSITELETLLSSLLDATVASWGLSRNAAQSARVLVRFYATTSAAMTVSVGQQVTTRGSSPVTFEVVSGVAAGAPTFDSTLGLYYVELMCEAAVAGADGNVAAGRVVAIVGALPGVVQCSNPIAAYGGADAETDADLIVRAGTVWRAQSLDTVPGLQGFIKGQPLVDDAYVAKSNNLLVTRDQRGMPIDIFVSVVSQPQRTTDTIRVADAFAIQNAVSSSSGETAYPPSTSSTLVYYLNRQPVISLESVVISGTSTSVGAVLVQDTTSAFSGSSRARSYVLVTGITAVTTAQGLTFTYSFDAAVAALQTALDHPDHDLLSHDVLVRAGKSLSVQVTAKLIPFVGGDYPDEADLKTTVEADLTKLFAGGTSSQNRVYARHKIGESVDYSDILAVMADTYGVDRIDNLTVVVNGVTVTTSYSPQNSEYARLESVTWL